MADLKPIPEFNGKYWISEAGEVYRFTSRNRRKAEPVATSGGRCRLYFNSKQTRPHVETILAKVWGPEAAKAYKEKNR